MRRIKQAWFEFALGLILFVLRLIWDLFWDWFQFVWDWFDRLFCHLVVCEHTQQIDLKRKKKSLRAMHVYRQTSTLIQHNLISSVHLPIFQWSIFCLTNLLFLQLFLVQHAFSTCRLSIKKYRIFYPSSTTIVLANSLNVSNFLFASLT